MARSLARAALATGLALMLAAPATARAQARGPWPSPDGAELVRLLGAHAIDAFAAPGKASQGIHARVLLPAGMRASDVGLSPIADGIARLSAQPAGILAFADAHPDLRIEVSPPLHTLLNDASRFVFANQAIEQGLDGSGVLVGIADTGLDVTHPDFLDAQGHSRVAWLLDLSVPPLGKHPDLEPMYGGAVWSGQDIDAAIAAGDMAGLPHDEVGHGTFVTACAAGNGASGTSPYRGIAPGATLVVARITGAGTSSIDVDNVLEGVAFLFDRATALGKPIVVNLSSGSDFGPHDGTTAWEQALASYVGPSHPGRAIVAAAGNGGSISPDDGALIHQSLHVSAGTSMRVPIPAAASMSGGVQIWVAMHAGASLRVGLDAPDGTWIDPVAPGKSGGKHGGAFDAGIYNGSESGSPVPVDSHGAVVSWQGAWPAGTYAVTLSGSGTVDLYLQATGDALGPREFPLGFAAGVRESTISLPATHPSILGVGCTINKTSWVGLDGSLNPVLVPVLDGPGGMPSADGSLRFPVPGEPCWFSSAGPTLTGVAKPEIMAPGAGVVAALSTQAVPPSAASIFDDPVCDAEGHPACRVVDALHGFAEGTSISSPIVAGAIAVLLQHDPTLTEDQIVAALQAGAHPLRGPALFADQAGPGEVDVLGAVAAVDRMNDPQLALPVRSESWLAPAADVFLADGSTPLQAVLELRAARTGGAAPPADGFEQDRLAAYALVDGQPREGAVALARRGPGVWLATVTLPAGLGGSQLTLGATFDGAPIVDARTLPIATDEWTAEYPVTLHAGCGVGGSPVSGRGPFALAALGIVGLRRRRPRRPRKRHEPERVAA
jgi:MYXO-CTERM domain-containing protein